MEGSSVPARWILAAAFALHAFAAGAQAEPTAAWGPRAATSTATATPTSTSTATSTATATSTPTASFAPAPAAPPLEDAPPPPYRLPSPRSGDYRWNLSFEFGPAAAGAPNGLLGLGLALGTIAGIRLETNVLFGFSSSSESVAVDPSWRSSAGTAYTSAEWTSRTVLLELSASRRQGPAELWLGSGVHVSWVQWEGSYSFLRCTDLLCFGPKVPSSDSDVTNGSGAVGLLVGAGARLAITDHVLLGLSARWLAPATSNVGAQFQRDVRTGGLAVGAGLTLRFGGAVPRGAVLDRP